MSSKYSIGILCIIMILILSGCGGSGVVPLEESPEREKIVIEDKETHLAHLYASVTCMVADPSFGENNNYTTIDDVYEAYGYPADIAGLELDIYASNSSFGTTLFNAIEVFCSGTVSEEKRSQIVEQLRRDAS